MPDSALAYSSEVWALSLSTLLEGWDPVVMPPALLWTLSVSTLATILYLAAARFLRLYAVDRDVEFSALPVKSHFQ